MHDLQVTVNGRTLTTSEATTLRMVIKMGSVDLETLLPDRLLEGIGTAEHLDNLARLSKLVGNE